jgi:hypothetical protein
MKNFFQKNVDSILLSCVLFTAFLLRVYRLPSIPFMHDEFSAIFRTQFDSFSELIEKGVMVDGHPPAVQIFLFYWIRIFGISEAWLKFPFIVAGVLSVFFAYKIAQEWFGKTSAIVISILIAFLQYPIMYSQIIRPYGSGLLFILVFTYFWNKIIFHPEQNKIKNIIGFVISGVLCAYDHHFALLQVAIIGLSGLFFIKRIHFLRYLTANILIVILYLPNLPIFFAQLHLKGIEGWLEKPANDFILNYLEYIIHFSLLVGISLGLVFILGLFIKPFTITNKKCFTWLSLIWFIIPYLIGFFYSIYVNSVLQYSVLIFAFPFLIFGIFGWIRSNNLNFRILAAVLLSAICIYSLIFERKHYQIFYNSPYEQIVENAKSITDSLGATNCLTVLSISIKDTAGTPAKAFKYYSNKFQYKTPFIIADALTDYKYLQKSLENFKGNYVYYGYLSIAQPEIYPIIQHYFPYIKQVINYAGGNAVVFSKTPVENKENHSFVSENSFECKVLHWEDFNQANIDSLSSDGKYSYRFDSIAEWGPSFTDTLFNISTKNDFIDISVDVMPLGNFTNAQLVSSIDKDTVQLDWRSSQFKNFNIQPGHWTTICLSIKLPDMKTTNLNPLLKVYIWNSEKQNFLIDRFRVSVRKGNPILYWIVTKEVKSE